MTANFVYRDASWESDSSLELLRFLITEYFGELFVNESVNLSTDSGNIGFIDTF